LQTAKQCPHHPPFVRSNHEHTKTLLHCTSRSPISVDVRVGRPRNLEVDYMVDCWNVKATSRDISG